jgi:predicted flap endonuclease-1-like 5' DNA nuclease
MTELSPFLWWFAAGVLVGWMLLWAVDKLFWRAASSAEARTGTNAPSSEIEDFETLPRASTPSGRSPLPPFEPAAARDGFDGRLADRDAEPFAQLDASGTPAHELVSAPIGQINETDLRMRDLPPAMEQKTPLADRARQFGFAPQRNGRDDLTLIVGIGPRIADLLREAGIDSFAKLAATPATTFERILYDAGPHFCLANPNSWAKQAALCVNRDWAALRAMQDALDGGRPRDA